jgi:superfamily II DNA or RNA helicase
MNIFDNDELLKSSIEDYLNLNPKLTIQDIIKFIKQDWSMPFMSKENKNKISKIIETIKNTPRTTEQSQQETPSGSQIAKDVEPSHQETPSVSQIAKDAEPSHQTTPSLSQIAEIGLVTPDEPGFQEFLKRWYKDIEPRFETMMGDVEFTPTDYQNFTREYLYLMEKFNKLREIDPNKNYLYKGILFYHGMGTGKTCTAVTAAEYLLNRVKRYSDKKILILLKASIKQNFKEDLLRVCGGYFLKGSLNKDDEFVLPSNIEHLTTEQLDEHFEIVNYNNSIFHLLISDIDLDNRIVIIDEIHNLLYSMSGYTSKRGSILYRKLYDAKNIKLICLSGTPIVNDPFETAALFNILKQPPNNMALLEFLLDKMSNNETIEYQPKGYSKVMLFPTKEIYALIGYKIRKSNKDIRTDMDLKKIVDSSLIELYPTDIIRMIFRKILSGLQDNHLLWIHNPILKILDFINAEIGKLRHLKKRLTKLTIKKQKQLEAKDEVKETKKKKMGKYQEWKDFELKKLKYFKTRPNIIKNKINELDYWIEMFKTTRKIVENFKFSLTSNEDINLNDPTLNINFNVNLEDLEKRNIQLVCKVENCNKAVDKGECCVGHSEFYQLLILIDEALKNKHIEMAKMNIIFNPEMCQCKLEGDNRCPGKAVYPEENEIYCVTHYKEILKKQTIKLFKDTKPYRKIIDQLYSIENNILPENISPGTIRNPLFIENKEIFDHIDNSIYREKIKGVISYYRGGRGKDYPTSEEKPLFEIDMSDVQFEKYYLARTKEEYERDIKQIKKVVKKLGEQETLKETGGIFRAFSRQTCNWIYDVKDKNDLGNMKKFENFINQLIKYDNKGRVDNIFESIFDQYKPKQETILEFQNLFTSEKLKLYGPKILAILNNIKKSSGPVFIYSHYRNYGVEPMSIALQLNNIDYVKWVGGLDDNARNTIKKQFNDSNNRYKKIVFLASSAGSEGIDLKNIRQVHIMEPHWNETKILQTIGRAIRKGSHSDLPSEDRHVEIYRYVMNLSNKNQIDTMLEIEQFCPTSRSCVCTPNGNILTTDQFIYDCSKNKQNRINGTLQLLHRMAIDCSPNFEINSDLYEIYQNIKNLVNFDKDIKKLETLITKTLYIIENSELTLIQKEQISLHLNLIYLLIVYSDSNNFPLKLNEKIKYFLNESLYLNKNKNNNLDISENKSYLIATIKSILLEKLNELIISKQNQCFTV